MHMKKSFANVGYSGNSVAVMIDGTTGHIYGALHSGITKRGDMTLSYRRLPGARTLVLDFESPAPSLQLKA